MARAWGVYSVFISEDVASDKRLDVTSVSSAVPLGVLQKGLTVDFEESPGLGLFGKSGAGKATTLLLSWLNSWQIPGLPGGR